MTMCPFLLPPSRTLCSVTRTVCPFSSIRLVFSSPWYNRTTSSDIRIWVKPAHSHHSPTPTLYSTFIHRNLTRIHCLNLYFYIYPFSFVWTNSLLTLMKMLQCMSTIGFLSVIHFGDHFRNLFSIFAVHLKFNKMVSRPDTSISPVAQNVYLLILPFQK